MGRNFLDTGREGLGCKRSWHLFHGQKAKVVAWLWEFPPERSEAWTPGQAPNNRAPLPVSPNHTTFSSGRLQSFCPTEREMEPVGNKATLFSSFLSVFLRSQHTKFTCAATHLSWAKGKQCGLELHEVSLDWESWERGEGNDCWVPCARTCLHTKAAIFLEKSKPLPWENNYPILC